MAEYDNSKRRTGLKRAGQEKAMDPNAYFLSAHAEHFVTSRKDACSQFHYGNGSFVAVMIAGVAAGIRRAASAIEQWARGANVEVVDYRLPRTNSAR